MDTQTYNRNTLRVFTWLVILLAVIATVKGISLSKPTVMMLTHKRSAMDLAMIQLYWICDADKNGVFAKTELQCVQKVIYILVTGQRWQPTFEAEKNTFRR